jgi:glycosyltransferase involved in cell wall biosynthesis
VVHVIADLQVGGAQRLLLTWAGEARRRGEPVTVVSLSETGDALGDQLRALDAEVVTVPTGSWGPVSMVVQVVRVARVLRRRRPAVVQTHLTRAHLVGLPASRLARTPAVATLHSMLVGSDGNSDRALATETQVLRHLARALLACGAVVERRQRARLAPATAHVVPNGVAAVTALDPRERAALRTHLVGSTEPFILLAVGRLADGKGHDDLLTAFADVVEQHAGCVLVVVGDGPLAGSLERQAADLGITAWVRLVGQRHDVASVMAAADIYVSASHFEGLPLAMLEAMSAGLPAVVTAVGDVPTVVDASCGVLVAPQDPSALAAALGALLSDPDRARSLGVAARHRAGTVAGVAQWYDRTRAVHDLAEARSR